MKKTVDEDAAASVKKENALIEAVFSGNEPLLKTLRALFLGLPITAQDEAVIKSTFADEALRKIMWHRFCPTIDRSTPIGMIADAWLGAESMVYGVPRDTIYQAVQYKKRAIEYTKQALALLENPSGQRFNLAYDPDDMPSDELEINLLARNQFIRHVEKQLLYLWTIAAQKTEKPEVIQDRLKRNSAQ